MPVLELSGVSVDFPFEPYQCQIDYMTTFLNALQTKTHALLESPTGTGKTLCLLCASLAWQESCKARIELHRMQMRRQATCAGSVEELESRLTSAVGALESDPMSSFAPSVPKVIFASRTHAQLSQAVQQLKQTAYRAAKVGIVGSRDQLCLHEEVRNLESNASKVLHCRMRVKRRACEFYNNFDANRTPEPAASRSDKILDIEELVSIGRERRCCPYYLARELKQAADLLFMPYNYLLDARIRRLHNIDLQNAVLIFDEAHNIEQVCEDSASVQLSSSDLAMAIEELRMVAQELHKALSEPGDSSFSSSTSEDDLQPETHLGPVLAAKGQLLELEQALDRQEVRKDEGLVRPGEFIFELLGEANISRATFPGLQQLLERILRSVTGSANYRLRQASGLSKVEAFLQAVFDGSAVPQVSAFYRVFLRDVEGGQQRQRQLCYWCFSPGRAMGELLRLGVRSLVLTSGTLYPLEAFKTGLGVPFSGELRNPHVIERRQLWLGVLQRGPDGTRLNSSYESRDSVVYQASLGSAIANLARLVPNGLLVFFPSYALLQKCLSAWRSCSNGDVFNRIAAHKAVIVEPRGKAEFQQALQEFEQRTRDPALPGAVFLGVARGKVSEGMDFADHLARAVIVTGLPYAPFLDPRVKLKMAFLDEARVETAVGLTGRAWYRQDAWRAVNQAIGRVIRHRGDFGAVLLCDERFGSAEAKLQLPAWMRADLRVFGQFGACLRDLASFFRAAGEEFPAPQAKLGRAAVQGPHQRPAILAAKSGPSSAVHRAADRERLGPSLSDAAEAAHMSLAYAGGPREAEGPSAAADGGLMSLLERHERQMDGRRSLSGAKRLLTPSGSQGSSDPLERRLEQLQKRKKLVVKAQPAAPACTAYLSRVRRALSPEAMEEFSAALHRYKADADLQALKQQLLQVFVFHGEVQLARDFGVFVRAEHRSEFGAFCREQLGLEEKEEEEEQEEEGAEKENEAPCEPQCARCAAKKRPGLVLLAPPCRHLCCFACWRAIIEQGNKRCPACRRMVRRRDLSRLNFEKTGEKEQASGREPIGSEEGSSQ